VGLTATAVATAAPDNSAVGGAVIVVVITLFAPGSAFITGPELVEDGGGGCFKAAW